MVDPQKTTQEMVDQASYLVNHPEALMEAAKMVYHNFDEGTPEEKAAMLGLVASLLVPGLSLTKSGKVAKVVDGVQDVTTQAMDGVKDLGKVLQNAEHFTGFPNLNPFLNTPEGFTFNVGKITPDTNPLPKTSVQEHYLNEMDGLGDVKAGKIEGTGEVTSIPKLVHTRVNVRNGDANVKGSGLNYALGKHGGMDRPNKSQFSISRDELKGFLQSKQVVNSPVTVSPTSGDFVRQIDVGYTIGNLPVNRGGAPTSTKTVITDKKGNLVNTFLGGLGFGE